MQCKKNVKEVRQLSALVLALQTQISGLKPFSLSSLRSLVSTEVTASSTRNTTANLKRATSLLQKHIAPHEMCKLLNITDHKIDKDGFEDRVAAFLYGVGNNSEEVAQLTSGLFELLDIHKHGQIGRGELVQAIEGMTAGGRISTVVNQLLPQRSAADSMVNRNSPMNRDSCMTIMTENIMQEEASEVWSL